MNLDTLTCQTNRRMLIVLKSTISSSAVEKMPLAPIPFVLWEGASKSKFIYLLLCQSVGWSVDRSVSLSVEIFQVA